MNAKIDRDENVDINHRERYIIQLMREWIKNPFNLDLVPQVVTFQALAHPIKGKSAKVIVPTFPAQSLVRLEIVYQHERNFGCFRVDKGKNKRKRDSPKKVDLETKEHQD